MLDNKVYFRMTAGKSQHVLYLFVDYNTLSTSIQPEANTVPHKRVHKNYIQFSYFVKLQMSVLMYFIDL